MDIELIALIEEPVLYDGTVLVDVTAGIVTPTHQSAKEIDDNEIIIDLSLLPVGTKQLKLKYFD